MTEREALKLALEALENLFGIPDKWTGEGGGDVAVWRLGGSYRAQQAITAIKEALAQPEPEYIAFMDTPQRKPLTDEEALELWNKHEKHWRFENNALAFARAIEAAHGIKGEA